MKAATIHRSPGAGERGMTLVEVMFASVSMLIVLGGSMALMMSSRGAMQVGGTQSSLQEVGRRILNEVLSDIRRSGLTTVVGGGAGNLGGPNVSNFPAIYVRKLAPATSSKREQLIASMNYADAGMVDEVLAYEGNGNRIDRNEDRDANEFVFQLPTDLDGDGMPIDANGDLEWGQEQFSYRLIQDPNGIPWLYRVTEINGLSIDEQRVGPFVQNITFDVVFNDRSLRFGEVAVVLYMQKQNERGQIITAALEGSVVLRNTREL